MLKENQKRIVDRIFPNCTCVNNYHYARLGRIWILFDADVRVHVHSSFSQVMHCNVFLEGEGKYFFSYQSSMLPMMRLKEDYCGLS